MLLSMSGHRVETAHDGTEAVEKARSFRPDLVILDLGMPRLNGYGACRAIRQQPWGHRITIAALTGWGQPQDREKSREAGFDLHLVKPIGPSELQEILASTESHAVERDPISGDIELGE